MTEKRRPGRRSLSGGSPLAHTSITAFPEQLIFYLLLSGDSHSVSAGIQKVPDLLAEEGNHYEGLKAQAKWMVDTATKRLGNNATLQDVYKYVSDNFRQLVIESKETRD